MTNRYISALGGLDDEFINDIEAIEKEPTLQPNYALHNSDIYKRAAPKIERHLAELLNDRRPSRLMTQDQSDLKPASSNSQTPSPTSQRFHNYVNLAESPIAFREKFNQNANCENLPSTSQFNSISQKRLPSPYKVVEQNHQHYKSNSEPLPQSVLEHMSSYHPIAYRQTPSLPPAKSIDSTYSDRQGGNYSQDNGLKRDIVCSEKNRQIQKMYDELTTQIEKEFFISAPRNQRANYNSEYFGNCNACSKPIIGRNYACQALNNVYHASCFVCHVCGLTLKDRTFYCVDNKVFCEKDYHQSGFQRCYTCGNPIIVTIIYALGKPYHPECFRCYQCSKTLDGIPFSVGPDSRTYCVEDYRRLFASVCSGCNQAFSQTVSSSGEITDAVKLVYNDYEFHPDCYKCLNCNLSLISKRCLMYRGRIFCDNCYKIISNERY